MFVKYLAREKQRGMQIVDAKLYNGYELDSIVVCGAKTVSG
jgi:hypothetical protein